MEPKPTKEAAGKALIEFAKILDDMGIIFELDGGTLLGMYRDGDFCDDDQDDIDLTTLNDPGVMHEILDRAAAQGFKVYKTWREEEKKSAQLSVKKGCVKIDLMFKRKKGGRVWWTVYRGGKVVYKSIRADRYNARLYETPYGVYLIPGEAPDGTEAYLTERYGDWRTPVHRDNYSCYSTDKAIVKSYEEI